MNSKVANFPLQMVKFTFLVVWFLIFLLNSIIWRMLTSETIEYFGYFIW